MKRNHSAFKRRLALTKKSFWLRLAIIIALLLILVVFLLCVFSKNISKNNNEQISKVAIEEPPMPPRIRTVEAEQLLEQLKALSDTAFMFGHHNSTVYGHTWFLDSGRSDVKTLVGDLPALLSFDLGGIEFAVTSCDTNGFTTTGENIDNIPFNRIRQEIISHYENGGVITLTWHAANPSTVTFHTSSDVSSGISSGVSSDASKTLSTPKNKAAVSAKKNKAEITPTITGTCWDVGDSAVQKILPSGSNHNKFLQCLDKVADFLNSIQTAQGIKVPVIFRPYHENTSGWFWWGEPYCSAEQYKELWSMTAEHLRKEASQILYAYSPSELRDTTHYLERYPGDSFTDIVGVNLYQYDDWEDRIYRAALPQQLDIITYIAKERGKVAALTEIGLEGLPEERWWTGKLLPIVSRYNIAYLLVWHNSHNRPESFYAPFKGQTSAQNFINFYRDPRSLFLKNMKE